MKFFFGFLIVLYTSGTHSLDSEISKQIRSRVDLEVPNSPLMLLEKHNTRKLVTAKHYSRKLQKKHKQNSNSTTTTSSTSSSSSSSSRRCQCELGVCKCCTGYLLDLFDQKACMRVTYHPGDFAFDVAMSMNDRILYETSMSGKNPRPMCISPPRIPALKVCTKFYNVFFPGRNFHFCMAMTGQWRKVQLFDVAFDCLRMGANGIAMVKPEDNAGIPVANPLGGVDAVVDAGPDDIEDYDENLVKSLFSVFDDGDDDDEEYDDDR